MVGGPGSVVTVPAASGLGFVGGSTVGWVGGMINCKTGGGGGGYGGGGGGSELNDKAKRKVGNLANRAGEKVRDVIRSRGGSASNVNQAGPWADRTLGEAAEAAANRRDSSAETAIKNSKTSRSIGPAALRSGIR